MKFTSISFHFNTNQTTPTYQINICYKIAKWVTFALSRQRVLGGWNECHAYETLWVTWFQAALKKIYIGNKTQWHIRQSENG